MSRARGLMSGIAVLMVATACSSIHTEPDQVALHYAGGPLTGGRPFRGCVDPASRDIQFTPGEKSYAYPTGQRTFSFTGKSSADDVTAIDPLSATTKDSQVVTFPGYITFVLDTNCTTLRQFHERIGLKFKAWMDGDSTSDGWDQMLATYMEVPLKQILNDASLEHGWLEIYNNTAVQTEISNYVQTHLPASVDKAMGGHYLTNIAVNLSRPSVSPTLQSGLNAIQARILAEKAQVQQNNVLEKQFQAVATCVKVLSATQTGSNPAGVLNTCVLLHAIDSGDVPFIQGGSGTNLNLPTK